MIGIKSIIFLGILGGFLEYSESSENKFYQYYQVNCFKSFPCFFDDAEGIKNIKFLEPDFYSRLDSKLFYYLDNKIVLINPINPIMITWSTSRDQIRLLFNISQIASDRYTESLIKENKYLAEDARNIRYLLEISYITFFFYLIYSIWVVYRLKKKIEIKDELVYSMSRNYSNNTRDSNPSITQDSDNILIQSESKLPTYQEVLFTISSNNESSTPPPYTPKNS